MRLSYYTYAVEDHGTGERFLCDLRRFLAGFVELADIGFKNRFMHAGENVYLLKVQGDLYVFIITRSNEIIKKIKSSDLSLSEISDLLQLDEHLGFASYVYFGDRFIGFASTIMAPKAMSFANFFNDVLNAIQLHDFKFVIHPVLQESTFADALSMPFIGRSVLQVSKENGLFNDVRNFFGGTVEEFADVDSFEIIIKPANRRNIESAVKTVIKKLPQDGLEKFTCRAKEEMSDQLTDLYLVGKGMLSDLIMKGTDLDIYLSIKEKIVNPVLVETLRELNADERFTKKTPEPFAGLRDATSWADRISTL